MPKSNGQLYFDLPENYLTDRYRTLGQSLQNRFGSNISTRVPVQNITPPDIGLAQSVPRRGGFSVFNTLHRRAAGQLIELFLNQSNPDALFAVAAYCRDRLNAPLFQYALSVALQHRPDTANIPIPNFLELFPDRFIEASTFPQLQEEGRIVSQGDRVSFFGTSVIRRGGIQKISVIADGCRHSDEQYCIRARTGTTISLLA